MHTQTPSHRWNVSSTAGGGQGDGQTMNKHYLLTLSIEVALAQAGFDASRKMHPAPQFELGIIDDEGKLCRYRYPSAATPAPLPHYRYPSPQNYADSRLFISVFR